MRFVRIPGSAEVAVTSWRATAVSAEAGLERDTDPTTDVGERRRVSP